MTRSKDIGTAAETGVVKAARAAGFPQAERRALRGASDVGDVLLCPGVVIEVKAGKAAKDASLAQVGAWMLETERERGNAGAEIGLLVVQRRGFAPARAQWWDCWMQMETVVECVAATRAFHAGLGEVGVMMSLGHAFLMLRGAGWGDPF